MKQIVKTHSRAIVKKISYALAGTEVTVAKLPAGAIASVNVTVDEAFDNLNTVNVGIDGTAGKFISAFDVVAGKGKNSDVKVEMTDTHREIKATVSGTANAGAITVTVDFMLPTEDEVNY